MGDGFRPLLGGREARDPAARNLCGRVKCGPRGPEDAAASRRGARPARGGHTRSLLARGEQCQVLVRQPGFPRAAFYSYPYPEPAGFGERAATPGPTSTRSTASLSCHIIGSARRQILTPCRSIFCPPPVLPPPQTQTIVRDRGRSPRRNDRGHCPLMLARDTEAEPSRACC